MNHRRWRCAALLLAAALPAASTHAQLDSLLGKGAGGNPLAGLAGMQSGSMGNVAGLLQYCIGNNYLSGEGATSVQDKLIGKLPGGAGTEDRGYSDGRKGLLQGSDGKQLDLGGGGAGGNLTDELKKKACDTVLAQARSFL